MSELNDELTKLGKLTTKEIKKANPKIRARAYAALQELKKQDPAVKKNIDE